MNVKIFLDDLYQGGSEPKKNEVVFQIDLTLENNYLVKSIKQIHSSVGQYGGKVDKQTFHTNQDEFDYINITNCYIIRDIKL